MTFLNALLALGALAFTVPLAIHLLFRSRFRTLEWGAMHLLDNVIRINRRRIQLLHLLLLFLRCMLPVLLAFCLARPVLTGFHSLPGDAPQSLILAIDDSRSMSARDASGISRMDHAKQSLGQWLGRMSRRDEVILIRSSNVEAPAATMGPQEAIGRLREVSADSGPIDLSALLRAAIEAADDASHPQRRVIVVSDFQSHNLNDATIKSTSRLNTLLAEKTIRPVFSFWNLGVDSDELANVSVESVELESPAVVAGRGARFSARLRNASDTPARDLRVVWSIDGQPLDPSIMSIPPRSSGTVRLSRRIEEAGVHTVAVSLEHADALIADNRRSIAVDVIREINVLLVDGKPSNRPLEGETDFLAIALSPFAFGGEDQPDAVRTHVVRNQRLDQEIAERSPDIVVLANVDSIRDADRNAISQFVLGGGALVVFDGDSIKSDEYNKAWASEEGSWNLPARMGSFVGSEAVADAKPLPIGPPNAQYSPWHVLGPADEQPFGDVDVYGYRRLTLIDPDQPSDPEGNETNSAAVKLLSMSGGDPIVVSARRGRGQVVQFAVPCDTAWTTFPMRRVFLPMMQQLVLDLAGSRKQMTVDVGNGFSVAISELASPLKEGEVIDETQNATFTLEPPRGSESVIEPTAGALPEILVSTTPVPGIYRVRQSTPIKETEVPIVTSTLRVAEVPSVESILRDAEPSRLTAVAASVDANIYGNMQALEADDRTRRYGREVWRWLLVGLLVFMIAELFIQQRTMRSTVVGAS